MKLHEYQAKELLARYGVPVPASQVARTPEEAQRAAEALGGKVVVKAQVHAGGRGKAGGVKLCATPAEARAAELQARGATNDALSMMVTSMARMVQVGRSSDSRWNAS